MSEIQRPRRYYLLKRLLAREECSSLEQVWRSQQEAQPGTDLPASFPSRSQLVELGYSTEEDLRGADEAELVRAGLNTRSARAVLAALQQL